MSFSSHNDATRDEHAVSSEGEPQEQENVEAAMVAEAEPGIEEQLIQRGNNGANWFFWIAVLSLINTAMVHSGADRHFVVGLGVTLIVDAVAHEIGRGQPEAATIAMGVAIGFSVFVSVIAGGFGLLARQRILIVYGLGMFLYLLDGLLFLLLQDWMSLGFHAFALFSMWGGFNAYRQLRQLQTQAEPGLAVA